MAKPILVANWKNYPSSLYEAASLLKEISKKRKLYKKTALFVAPPAVYFAEVAVRTKGFASLASQDVSALPRGTYTGEITPEILKSFGVRLSIVGHSERRSLGESAEDVRQKIRIALRSGITPLICFGEEEHDQDGEHFEFLRDELKRLLSGLSKREVAKTALAYEPSWAIGKSAEDALPLQELSQTVIFVKKVLADLFGRSAAESVPILYGGSVEPENAGELMKNSGIRGFLVGHASLKAKSFEAVARAITEK